VNCDTFSLGQFGDGAKLRPYETEIISRVTVVHIEQHGDGGLQRQFQFGVHFHQRACWYQQVVAMAALAAKIQTGLFVSPGQFNLPQGQRWGVYTARKGGRSCAWNFGKRG
jgi:hypothetical protein